MSLDISRVRRSVKSPFREPYNPNSRALSLASFNALATKSANVIGGTFSGWGHLGRIEPTMASRPGGPLRRGRAETFDIKSHTNRSRFLEGEGS